MTSTRIILQVVGLALLTGSALAIQCYNCDSSRDEHCANITSSSRKPVTCLKRMVPRNSEFWLRQLISITYFPSQDDNSTEGLVCQKIVGKKGEMITTIRGCQLDTADPNACGVVEDNMNRMNLFDAKIISCDICSDDSCNAAPSLFISVGAIFGFFVHLLRFLF